jgi:hypothetical protein
MPFGLNNAPTIFLRVVIAAFKEFIHDFRSISRLLGGLKCIEISCRGIKVDVGKM